MTIISAAPKSQSSGYTDTMLQLLEHMNQVGPSEVSSFVDSYDSSSSMDSIDSSSSFEEPFVIQEPHGITFPTSTLNVEPETPLGLRNLIQHTPGEFFAFQQNECADYVSHHSIVTEDVSFSPMFPSVDNKRKRVDFSENSAAKKIKLEEQVVLPKPIAPPQMINLNTLLGTTQLPASGQIALTQEQVNQLLFMLAQQTNQGPPVPAAQVQTVKAVPITPVKQEIKPKVPTLEVPPKTPKRRQKKSPETPTDEQQTKYLVCRGGIKRKNKKSEPGDEFQLKFKLRM